MGAFHVFKIVQMVPNRPTHHLLSAVSKVDSLFGRFSRLINSFCSFLTRCTLAFRMKYTLLAGCSIDSFSSGIPMVLSSDAAKFVAEWSFQFFCVNSPFSSFNLNPFKRQPLKMVKHTQTIRWQKPFDHFVGLTLKGLDGAFEYHHASLRKFMSNVVSHNIFLVLMTVLRHFSWGPSSKD